MHYQFCPLCGARLVTAQKFGKLRSTCPACGFVHFDDPKVAVATFITYQGRVLLVRRGVEPEIGKWALPAGYVDYGENPQSAAIRETLEETGIPITISGLLDVMYYEDHNKVIVIIYQGEALSFEPHAGDDATAAGWFSPQHLPEVAFESTQAVLRRWKSEESS